ncbi:MAG TPA: hypothetical protein LFV92_05770 [Rickettsia endosymbiont of Ceroptres masudai]|nr:hypothetical protein [Rickettsia endosymbiont of Ceroptres masudai]
MSFLRKQESSKTYKKQVVYIFILSNYVTSISILKLFFWIPAFAGMT